MNTDTPRVENYLQNFNSQFVPAEFARNLERELADKTNEVERLREELDRLKRGCQGSCYACEPVGEMNLKLEAEVARLRELLKKALFELEKVPFQNPKLTAFTAHRLADRYREQINQLTSEKLHNQ